MCPKCGHASVNHLHGYDCRVHVIELSEICDCTYAQEHMEVEYQYGAFVGPIRFTKESLEVLKRQLNFMRITH